MKADSEKRAETDFLSNMSHEIRTPLNVIIGMCDIARFHIDDIDKVSECLKKISAAGDHLIDLVNNVLDITKIEDDKMLIKEEPFSMDHLAEEVRTLIGPLAERKGIVFNVSAKDALNKNVMGDYSHLMQVIINLGTNAVKYTPDGGFVKIWIEQQKSKSPEMITYDFICEDNGFGMSQEFLEHIFEPFVRSEDAKVNKIQGAGLGMSIVKKIVDAMEGTIRIDSTEGEGTRVSVELDFKVAEGEEIIKDVDEYKRQQLEKIKDRRIVLLAEDEKGNREVISTYLEDLGFEAAIAENGEELVDMFIESEENFYKAIFMDLQMPIMNGYQATLMVRGLNRSDHDVPIIAMTANVFKDDRDEAERVGMNDYLTKPLKMEQLKKMLDVWV